MTARKSKKSSQTFSAEGFGEERSFIYEWADFGNFASDFASILGSKTQNRLPPAILFSGYENIGKHLLAIKAAASFVCVEENACGECPQCLQVKYDDHPDILVVNVDENSSQITLDHVSELNDHLSRSSVQVDWSDSLQAQKKHAKIAVVVDFDRANMQVQNSLLKLFEEPPEDAYIFLTSAKTNKILKTIHSRMMKWRLNAPRIEENKEHVLKWELAETSDFATWYSHIEETFKQEKSSVGRLLRQYEEYLNQKYRSYVKNNVRPHENNLALSRFVVREQLKKIRKFRRTDHLNAESFALQFHHQQIQSQWQQMLENISWNL